MNGDVLICRVEQDSGPDGWVVVDSTVAGRSTGGLRMLPDVTEAELRLLARAMTLKFGLLGLPQGGAKAGVRFDLLGTGRPLHMGWIQGDDAFLVWDRNGNGRVDNGQEMFGNVTRRRSGERAPNGYEALKEYDDNRDGLLDARDALFAQLRLWRDGDGNGETDSGELLPLQAVGIRALELTYRESRRRDRHGNELRYRVLVHGDRPTVTRFSYDVLFIWRGR